MKPLFFMVIWNYDRTKIIVLPSFQLAKRLNSQNRKETEFIKEVWHINIYIWLFVFPIGIIEVSSRHKWRFWLHFSSFHDYWPPITWNSLVHTSLGEMERCEKLAFQLLKMRKKKISLNIITKCVADFILTVRSSSMEDYSSHYGVNT